MRSARRLLPVLVAAGVGGLAGCGDGAAGSGGDGTPGGGGVASAPAAPAPVPQTQSPPVPQGESDGAIGVRVEQTRPGELVVTGATRAAAAVQVSVEDGHRVLFGPADVPVQDGGFRLAFLAEPSDRPTVFVFVTDPEGRHQTVVPVGRETRSAAAGPPVP